MKISVISNHFSDVSFKWEKETSGYNSNSFIIYLYSEVKKKTCNLICSLILLIQLTYITNTPVKIYLNYESTYVKIT